MRVVMSLFLLLVLSGCATVRNPSPSDPFESVNRAMFGFNETLDNAALKPLAKGYATVIPLPLRSGVRNFLGNIEDSWSFVNSILQGKPEAVGQNMGRVLLNTFVGMGGIFDFATPAGIERQEEDLGQTLAVWGVPRGPYLMLPLLGPSTVREAFGQGVWMAASPINQASSDVSYAATVLKVLDTRVQLLDVDQLVSDAATDRYSFIRSAYLQRREYLIRDGEPAPRDESFDSDKDEPKSSNQQEPSIKEKVNE